MSIYDLDWRVSKGCKLVSYLKGQKIFHQVKQQFARLEAYYKHLKNNQHLLHLLRVYMSVHFPNGKAVKRYQGFSQVITKYTSEGGGDGNNCEMSVEKTRV